MIFFTRTKLRICLFVFVFLLEGCDFFLPEKEKNLRSSLPDHIGKDLLIRKCGSCHGIEKALLQKSKDPKFWEQTILFMNKVNGMPALKEEEKKVLIDYLKTL